MQNGSTQLAAYDEFRAQLGELKQHNDSVVFDYEDPNGNREARSHIYRLRQTKGAVEKVRKAEKATYLELGRQVDAQAKEIVGEIDAMIAVHQAPLDEIEQREKDRQAKHQARLDRMAAIATESNEDVTADTLKAALAELESYKLGPHWEEFEVEAARVKERGIESLKAQIARREQYEAEQAELARLRREKEERERREREEQIAKAAAERATREAEEKVAAEREAAARREQELQEAAERAEREKAEAEERAQRAAAEAEERVRREAEAKAAQEALDADRRAANKRRVAQINRTVREALRAAAGLSEDQATVIVTQIARGEIPHVQICY